MVFNFVRQNAHPEEETRFYRAVVLYVFQSFRFTNSEMRYIVNHIPDKDKPMFESTYQMLIKEGMLKGLEEGEVLGIQKGEAIGIQKGKAIGIQEGKADGKADGKAIGVRINALDTLMQLIVKLPSLGDTEIAAISILPEAFIKVFRANFGKGNTRIAQKIAVGAFTDLIGFEDEDASKVKELVKAAIEKHRKKI